MASTVNDDYWEQSTQPLTSLLFVAPLLVLYEFGMIRLGPHAMRNGADVWLRSILAHLGLGEYLFLPLLTCGLLLGWHHLTRRAWRFQGDVIGGMFCESVLWGMGLVVLAHAALDLAGNGALQIERAAASVNRMDQVPHLLSFLGAGVYEELLFRLLLLSTLILICHRVGADPQSATVLAVIATSILFASAHYRIFFAAGGEFTWYSFVFRLAAGTLFSILFLRRGFGIAVGTHATYDVLIVTLS